MPSNVLFAPMAYTRYEASQTLPEKFSRLLEKSGLGDKVNGKSVAIKMHVLPGSGRLRPPGQVLLHQGGQL